MSIIPNMGANLRIDRSRQLRADLMNDGRWRVSIVETIPNPLGNLSVNRTVLKVSARTEIGVNDFLGLTTFMESHLLGDLTNTFANTLSARLESARAEQSPPREGKGFRR